MKRAISYILTLLMLLPLVGCREDIYIFPSTSTEVETPRITGVDGFYLINEGNMGSNKGLHMCSN